MTAVFLFQRDLRLNDNTTLLHAMKEGAKIIPVFIFTPEQINPSKNPYFSPPAVQFMCESLTDLNQQLAKVGSHLNIFYGEHSDVLTQIYKEHPFQTIYSNEDYSVYATKRDATIRKWCVAHGGIQFIQKEDYGLLPLKDGLLEGVRPYMVLSQFYKRILKENTIRDVATTRPTKQGFSALSFNHALPFSKMASFYQENPALAIRGGRARGLLGLKRLNQLKDYEEGRNFPALGKTSLMSPHLKFGTVSIREMYWAIVKLFGKDHGLIRELVFRDFYMKIYALRPELQRGTALHAALDKAIHWSYDKHLFQQWADGLTGYPLVDAGMRELNVSGHQHNRIRMLCASVLSKYFLIDWRWGLKYYYTHLVDADIYSNTAGWGFASSTGADAVPYFRAPFNPFIQSNKFDKEAEYIKHWVPELKEVDAKDIHKWFDPLVREKYKDLTTYPAPIIDHKEASARAVKVFKAAGARAHAH